MNTSKAVVMVMVAARIALACLVGTAACSGDVNIDRQIEVCPDVPEPVIDAGTCPVCPAQPDPPACVSCSELAVAGGDARALCDDDTATFYDVWECVVDSPQCKVCPAWPDYTVFAPTALDPLCLECLVFEGCGAELHACGVTVPL